MSLRVILRNEKLYREVLQHQLLIQISSILLQKFTRTDNIKNKMQNDKKYILTIAGHDPSGGAGITSDIKTFEAHGFYGLSVCTAVTVQNDIDFKQCKWISKEIILSQIETLFDSFDIKVVKI